MSVSPVSCILYHIMHSLSIKSIGSDDLESGKIAVTISKACQILHL